MANPSNCTVTIDGTKLNAFSANVGLSSGADESGMPLMGSLGCSAQFSADMHDTVNVPYSTVKKFFDLANVATRDKIKDIKIEFWTDESKQDALCVLSFKGWIRSWNVSTGTDANHVLAVTLEPAMNQKNFQNLQLSN